MNKDILVLTEHLQDKLQDVTFELLAAAQDIKKVTGGEIVALVLGSKLDHLLPQMGAADKVLYVDDENLACFNPEASQKILSHFLNTLCPRFLLLGNTSFGMDISSFLSQELNLPLVSSVTNFSLKDEKIVCTSQLYGGKILAQLEISNGMLLIMPGFFSSEKAKVEKAPQIEKVKPPIGDLKTRSKSIIKPEIEDIDLTAQEIIVSVGRGVQSEDNIPLAEEIAELLGGAVATTRPVVDQGWLKSTRQVGRSGVTVKPKLYFSFGISGAPEHVEGMKNSELIIAVNTDPQAPIFNVAHYKIVQDMLDFLPILKERLSQRKGK